MKSPTSFKNEMLDNGTVCKTLGTATTDCNESVSFDGNPIQQEPEPSSTNSDPGRTIRSIGLIILSLLIISGIGIMLRGCSATETYWSDWGHERTEVLTKTGQQMVDIASILLGFAASILLPILSLAAWRTSRWKCRTVKQWLNENIDSVPVRISSSNLLGSVGGWTIFWTIVSTFAGIALVIAIVGVVTGLFRPFNSVVASIVASSFGSILYGVLWILCLKDQTKEVEEVKRLLRIHIRGGNIVAWRKQQILDMVSNLVSIPGKTYKLGKYAVTQAQWESVMGDSPSTFEGDNLPVDSVSWKDCQRFLSKLNGFDTVRNADITFRLPTDNEWIFACRAGSSGDYCKLSNGSEVNTETLERVAWCESNAKSTTHPVGQKEPNAFGLFDMHGNVWEWTSTVDGDCRVTRGGSWCDPAECCSATFRFKPDKSLRFSNLGFRLCVDNKDK